MPSGDVEAFLRDAYPLLARRTEIRAHAGIELPPLPTPVPLLRLSFRRGDTVEYALEWEYRGFERMPMLSTSDAVRDPDAERRALLAIETAWTEASSAPFATEGPFAMSRRRSS